MFLHYFLAQNFKTKGLTTQKNLLLECLQCNLPEWQNHQTCEGKWMARMKTIIEDTEDDKKGKDYAEAANIWDSPKLQGWASLSTLDHCNWSK